MVKIRLSRTGRKKIALYRIVVMDSRERRDGRFIERLGEYNPMTKPATFKVDHERALFWMGQGAQLSETVHTLFHRDGVVKKFQLSKKGLDATTIEIERKAEKASKPKKRKKKASAEGPPAEAPKKEEPKAEAPKQEEVKAEAPKKDEPKAEAPEAGKQKPAENEEKAEPSATDGAAK